LFVCLFVCFRVFLFRLSFFNSSYLYLYFKETIADRIEHQSGSWNGKPQWLAAHLTRVPEPASTQLAAHFLASIKAARRL
jgi:hypothetical protein